MPQLHPCGRRAASPANTTAPAIAPRASPSSCSTRSNVSAELRVLRTRCTICSSHFVGLPAAPETACLRILIPSQRFVALWTCHAEVIHALGAEVKWLIAEGVLSPLHFYTKSASVVAAVPHTQHQAYIARDGITREGIHA